MNQAFLFLLAFAIAIFGVKLWKRHLQRARERYIETFDYGRLLDKRLSMKHGELDPAQKQQVFDALADYFQLCRMTGGKRMVSMPSQVVDDAWHEFILFTRNYATFCQRGLGRFLHHIPAEAMTTPTLAQNGIKRAWRLACKREGINPKKPDRLPRLFALDRELGIANGFHYVTDCKNTVARSDSSGTVYCGSAIGCGGSGGSDVGCGGSGSMDGHGGGEVDGGCGGHGCGGSGCGGGGCGGGD